MDTGWSISVTSLRQANNRLFNHSVHLSSLEPPSIGIELGVMERLREICLDAYDHLIGLELSEVAVDGCVTKAPCGGEKAGRTRSTETNGASLALEVDASGIPLGAVSAPANPATTHRCWSPPGGGLRGAGDAARGGERPPRARGYDSRLTRERLAELGL